MIDASTKQPSGLLGGNFFDLGHFDECYGIKNDDIFGKYCLGTYAVPLVGSDENKFTLNATQQKVVCNSYNIRKVLKPYFRFWE